MPNISISIDVTQLQKSRFKNITRKNGKQAVFCDLVLIEHASEYGDYIVKQSVSKEEREQRVEMPIIGNGKVLGKGKTRTAAPTRADSYDAPGAAPETDDVPFN